MGWFDALKNLLSGNGAGDVRPGSQIRANVSTSAPASVVVAAAEPKRVDAETNSPVKDNPLVIEIPRYSINMTKEGKH